MNESIELIIKNLEQINLILQVIFYIISVIGVPIFLLRFFLELEARSRERKKDVEQRIKENKIHAINIFQNADKPYREFLCLAFANPHLPVTWYNISVSPVELTPEQIIQKDILFDLLTGVFERVFLLYADESLDTEIREAQWRGWEAFIEEYCKSHNYRAWLEVHAQISLEGQSQFDLNFERFLRGKYNESYD